MTASAAIISYNSGGTLGHYTLAKRLSHALGPDPFLIANSGLCALLPAMKHFALPELTHQQSIAGDIRIPQNEDIARYALENGVKSVFFSTLFDSALVRLLRKNGIRSHYVSYPLRDSHSALFAQRGFDQLFNSCTVLHDLYITPVHFPAVQCRYDVTVASTDGQRAKTTDILISCGGGGRPSASSFGSIMDSALDALVKKELSVKVIAGPFASNYAPSRSKVKYVDFTDSFVDELASARLLVSEAGFYTLAETIASSVPAVCIPGARRIDNQELRAVLYEKAGFGTCHLPQEHLEQFLERVDVLLESTAVGRCENAMREHIAAQSRLPTIAERAASLIGDAGQ